MLTVKVMSPGGGEEIHCGLSVGFNPNQQSIAVSGMDQNVFLKQGEVAYVMNANGKTIHVTNTWNDSRHYRSSSAKGFDNAPHVALKEGMPPLIVVLILITT